MKNNKPLKITAFVLLIISFIPLLYTIGLCIYNGIVGLPVPDSDTIYGIKAFFGTLFASFITTWYVYIAALVLTIVSIILAIIAIGRDKKAKEKLNGESNNDLR